MYLQLHNGLLNLDLISEVIFHEMNKTATLKGDGVIVISDSKLAYRYFKGLSAEHIVVVPEDKD